MNYFNPTALQPQIGYKPDGFLGGYAWNQNYDDHQRMLQVAHEMNQLGLQQERQKTSEFMEGIPLRALQRQGQTETLQGELPFLREAAGAKQQHQIATQNFERETKFSPEAKTNFFRELKEKATDAQWKNYEREIVAGGQLAQKAMMIKQQQGELAAQAYVQQQIAALRQGGVSLPEHFTNPEFWPVLFQAAKNSIKHLQELEMEVTRGQWHKDVATIGAGATRYAADQRATQERNTNEVTLFNDLQQAIANGTATEGQKASFKSLLIKRFTERQSDFMMVEMMNASQQKRKPRTVSDIMDEYMAAHGFRKSPTPGGGERKAAEGYQIGGKYRDKNGTIRTYKGGPINEMDSWEN